MVEKVSKKNNETINQCLVIRLIKSQKLLSSQRNYFVGPKGTKFQENPVEILHFLLLTNLLDFVVFF